MKTVKKLFFSLVVIIFLIGICLVSYPTISNWINYITNDSEINEYNNNVSVINQEELNQIMNEATLYNEALKDDYFNYSNEQYQDILNEYNDILNFNNGLIGYIQIPKINVNLPIYHGGDEDILTKGAAHIEHTSFPIGGINSHAAISAHSGYPTQKFFDDLDELNPGDRFYIYILNKKLTYEVYDTDIVEPTDCEQLNIIEGKDIVTLVTCYPYSVNTHRLLVHASRVTDTEYEKVSTKDMEEITDKSTYNDLLIFLVSIVSIIIIILIIKYLKTKNRS